MKKGWEYCQLEGIITKGSSNISLKNKRAISEGGNIRIELPDGDKPKDYITLEGVSEAHLEK